ncbi:MAG: AMP-binding protein [Solirubrobacteraceae bacterium]
MYGLADIVHRNRTSALRDLDKIALVCGEEELTYAALGERVSRLAAGLHAAGFRRGDRCAILLHNRTEWLELLFAVAHLGGVSVPLNYFLKPKEVRFAVKDSGARWLASEAALWEGVASVAQDLDDVTLIAVDAPRPGARTWGELTDPTHPAVAMVPVMTDEPALLQYTSGTTGFPKGAVHTHGTLLFNAAAQIVDLGVGEDDVHLVVPALCWAAGLHCITLGALWRGATVVVRPTGNLTAPELCALIERRRTTTAMLAPSVLRIVLDDPRSREHDLSSMRLIISGGEPVSPELLGQVRAVLPEARLMQGYGVSEFPSTAAFLDDAEVLARRGAAGRASMLATIRVVDEDGHDLPPHEHGEIAMRAPSISTRYHGPADGPPRTAVVDGWLRTGDRGWTDEDGFLHVAGRVSEMYISGGLNVYPAEVERVLQDHDAVAEVAVVAVPHERYGQTGRAIVVLHEADAVTAEELEALCRDELANFKVPREWSLTTDPLPRTVSGKVRRFLLVPRESLEHSS